MCMCEHVLRMSVTDTHDNPNDIINMEMCECETALVPILTLSTTPSRASWGLLLRRFAT